MKATVRDVARAAGVGVATVSRVLNGSGYFDEETARKVRAAVAELGYRRNVHWTRLKRRTSDTVCFLLGNREAMNSMQMRMLVACETVLREKGLDLIFSGIRYGPEARSSELALPRVLAEEGMVDGVLLAGQHHGNLLESFVRMGMPYALAANNFTGKPSQIKHHAVLYDDRTACYEAVRYLARLGHRRIAFVGNQDLVWFRRRAEGYRAAIQQEGLSEIAVTHPWQIAAIEYGKLAIAELLRNPKRPTAVLAANDEVAAGIWKELIHRGVRVPREISLVGFGDREEFSILEPSLTSISVFPDKLGAELARMLLRRLEDPATAEAATVFPCQLMERASCGPPPAALSAALG
ncbi:MAG: LacI family DNA-binding transcriptional regulator [Bryobacterales bacterium]|nr:LacI family DNA-binding transcriptional regulator [Bryobacterales bacterium]